MFCIFMSCGMLAYEGPGLSESDPLYAYLAYGDLALLFVFVPEATLRILHKAKREREREWERVGERVGRKCARAGRRGGYSLVEASPSSTD